MSESKQEKSNWFLTTFPVILSLIALVFSGWSYYNSNLRVIHEVQVSVTDGPDDNPSPEIGPVNFTLTFLNRGNQAEAILGARVVIKPTKEISEQNLTETLFQANQRDDKYLSEAFALPAGQVKIWDLDAFMGLYRQAPDDYTIGVEVYYLDPMGEKQSMAIRVGNISTNQYGQVTTVGYQPVTVGLFE